MSSNLLVTGRRFLGKGFRAIEPVIEEMIKSANKGVSIASSHVYLDISEFTHARNDRANNRIDQNE